MAQQDSAILPILQRLRVRFSLRTLFLALVALSIFFAWQYDRRQLEERIKNLESRVFPAPRNVTAAWSTSQATGAPDTPGAGDIQTAWASATPDAQREWLLLSYKARVWPTAVEIHETFNPGALEKVSVFKADGTEVVVWQGTDPTPTTSRRGVSKIPINVNFKTDRVKVYLNSPAVRGWNEIDAVGLRDWWGYTFWATTARASSSYAQRAFVSGGVLYGR